MGEHESIPRTRQRIHGQRRSGTVPNGVENDSAVRGVQTTEVARVRDPPLTLFAHRDVKRRVLADVDGFGFECGFRTRYKREV